MLGLSKYYNVRPSTFFDISEPYTSYCFDEACAYISSKIENGEEPRFKNKFKSFTDMYKHFKNV